MTKTKLKILCLHGFRQNSAIFKDRLGGFRRFTKNEAEFDFVTAPHKVENEGGSKEGKQCCLNCKSKMIAREGSPSRSSSPRASASTAHGDIDERGWWFQTEAKDNFRGADESNNARGFDLSIQTVEEHVASHGPYDGLLGFSQGAAFVGMLCALQSQNNLKFQVNFAIMVSGFKSKCTEHQQIYHTKVDIPSLHVFGEQDKFISIEMSESLVAIFDNPLVMKHSGGHHVPSSGPQKNFYKDTYKHFLQSCATLKDDVNEAKTDKDKSTLKNSEEKTDKDNSSIKNSDSTSENLIG